MGAIGEARLSEGVSDVYAQRFRTRYVKDDVTDCWVWTASRHPRDGYGAIKIVKNIVAAHRFSWILHNGPIPEGLVVCHRCDNPPCVNPDHLFLGTQADNLRDMYAKGRRPSPLQCPSGHDKTGNNTTDYGGRGDCRECRRIRQAAWWKSRGEERRRQRRRERAAAKAQEQLTDPTPMRRSGPTDVAPGSDAAPTPARRGTTT